MSLRSNFFHNGYAKIVITESSSFLSLLKSIKRGDLPPNFTLVEKYKKNYDLRPSAHNFSPEFFNFLLFNDIPRYINRLSGHSLFLKHIQVRISHPRPRSYMDWHRDSHCYHNHPTAGSFPPSFKLIYYPNLDEPQEETLKIKSGSNKTFFKHKVIDKCFVRLPGNKTIIKSTNHQAIFFDTFSMHKALSPKTSQGKLRVIFSFSEDPRIDKSFSIDLQKKYLKEIYGD